MKALLELPKPERFRTDLNDGAIAGWRFKNADRPPLLFLHATGFCASAYRQMLSAASSAYDVYALDFRGHGCTSLPADPARLRSWRPFVEDVRAFLDQEQKQGWTLSGHSLGGATALMAAQGRSDIAALRLIEPVAAPAWLSMLAGSPVWPVMSANMPLVRTALRRRALWTSRIAAAASYAHKPLFKSWAPGVLEDYLEDGVKEADGEAHLACAPVWEAATFAAQANTFWTAARSAPSPISVFAADHRSSTVPPASRGRLQRLGATLTVKSGVTHLAPMENPLELAAFLVQERTCL